MYSIQLSLWLITLIAGLPQFAETVYTPSLPEIATVLSTTPALVESTITIYLFAFAMGVLFWGIVSDRIGRKPSIMLGFGVFILGCIGCYLSSTIEMLLFSRFVQAFGGSVGSVLSQAICRDALQGSGLSKAYAVVGSALAIFPAIGPIIGGLLVQTLPWYNIFLFLMICAVILQALVWLYLPETHPKASRSRVSIINTAVKMLKDKKVMACGVLVGTMNGIGFSYFGEGSFYLINLLGLSPVQYGLTFLPLSLAYIIGGLLSRYLLNIWSQEKLMEVGLYLVIIGAGIFSSVIFVTQLPANLIIVLLSCQMLIAAGSMMINSNALSLALTEYKYVVGTASSLFSFLYYMIIALFAFIMSLLHNGTLYPMPLYFLSLGLFGLVVKKLLLRTSVNRA